MRVNALQFKLDLIEAMRELAGWDDEKCAKAVIDITIVEENLDNGQFSGAMNLKLRMLDSQSQPSDSKVVSLVVFPVEDAHDSVCTTTSIKVMPKRKP